MTQMVPESTPVVDYSAIDAIVEEIVHRAAKYMKGMDARTVGREIRHAYRYARDAHEGQFRKSGDPYILHPVEAARLILTLKPDIVTIQCCFLHDVPEDTDRTVEDVEVEFGSEVAHIVAGMEKLSKLKYRGEDRSIGSLRKMFIAMSEDMRVILVKLADRLHNMRTLEFHPNSEKRERIALETLNIYAPIADRLGIFDFKEMLETECFRILHPADYTKITGELSALREAQENFVHRAKNYIREILPQDIPVVDVSFRVKSPYSIYKKMQRKDYEHVSDLYDLFALRIITDDVHHCYEILGLIHSAWTPIPKRFKDYIALPKENGYKSLHTTVIWMFKQFRQQPTEIQIRTLDMHRQAEIGVAAHFEYSESGKSTLAKDVYWVNELKQILETSADGDFMDEMKLTVFDDRIFVFTPKGSVINLPRGSTPIDFAYSIHSDLGNHIVIAKVNERVVPLDSVLRNADRVEIIIDKNKRPSITWLSFVKTSRAREVIKATLNKEQRESIIEKGRFALNAYLERHYGKTLDKELSILKNLDGHILDTKGKEDVLVQIGNLSRKPSSVVRAIREAAGLGPEHKRWDEPVAQKVFERDPKAGDFANVELILGGESKIPYHSAKCCNPEYPNRVVGYVNKNGITVHRIDCSATKKGSFDRFIPAYWSDQKPQEMVLKVEFSFENRIGVLKRLTEIVYLMQLDTVEIGQRIDKGGKVAIISMTLRSPEEDFYIFERLHDRIRVGIPELKEGRLLEMV